MTPLKSILAGVVLGLLALPVVAYVWAFSGRFPVATDSSPLPLEFILAHTALHYAAVRLAPTPPPGALNVNDADLASAAANYRTDCAFCHGLPNQPTPPQVEGMFPPPPQFFVKPDDDHASMIYWRVENGIRLTGMPAFNKSLTDAQIWQLTQLLHKAKHLPAQALAQLAPEPAAAAATHP
ncbi:MAG TPA: cytochrome c [Terriglobales bacterium]|nr:cytochrome c [Terriglobales bacterium]